MTEVIFTGPEGRLEGRYYQHSNPKAPIALILHPHPLHGGTMHNKVVYHAYHAFLEKEFSVLRFNFRGVGKSQGVFDNGVGELSDAASALDWLQAKHTEAITCWVAGFSFGAWIAMQLLMRRPEIEGFVSISPPVGMYDFTFLSPCPASGIILQGDCDNVVQESQVSKLATRLANQKNIRVDYQLLTGADHFYREHIEKLRGHVVDYISAREGEFTGSGGSLSQPDKKPLPSPLG